MEDAGFKKGMFCGSQTLQKIAEQLQFLTPPRVNTMEVEHFGDNIGSKLEIMESVAVENDEFCLLVNRRKKRAAVLICLFEGNEGELRVILTKRSMKLSSHPGDVALPGGKMEEGDADDSATALREAMEEIGLDPHLVQVVANLEPFISQHQLKVVPVVGLLARVEDFKPVLNTDEVDTLFDVPLEMFLKEENHRWEEKEWKGWNYSLHIFDFESEKGVFLIWGLTASILVEAASVIYQRSPCFEHRLRDFQQLQKALNNNSIA
uniref:Nudix hydrolase domain-containing protein n=1 Tax=Populus davidiana TaxID=266767 RepID=A0A6M2E7B8_9ROSI